MKTDLNPQDLEKIRRWFLVAIALAVFFAGGYGFGSKKIQIDQGQITIHRGNPMTTADYSLLWETLELINQKYVDQPLDQQKLLYGAVAGLVNAVGDPYTVFLNPDEAQKFSEELKGSFDGIGAEIGIKNDQLVIVAPLDDTPAARAGLLPGDFILAINNEPTIGMSVDAAVSKIRGSAGSEVTLTILHPNTRQPKEIKIARARIEVKSVKFSSREVEGEKIGVIKLNRFGEDTKGQFDQAVDTILSGGYSSLILDLRNNPGGFLDTSVQIAANWIEDGRTVVREVNFAGKEKNYPASGVARLKDLRTVVLVNGGSASASEIVAGALQDYKRATLVGEKTYGKGSVQELEDLKGRSNLKLTVAKWRTPNGRDINENGLEPDVVVEMTREDFDAGRDPQMDKALELLKQ